jgi:hypothetical protein
VTSVTMQSGQRSKVKVKVHTTSLGAGRCQHDVVVNIYKNKGMMAIECHNWHALVSVVMTTLCTILLGLSKLNVSALSGKHSLMVTESHYSKLDIL